MQELADYSSYFAAGRFDSASQPARGFTSHPQEGFAPGSVSAWLVFVIGVVDARVGESSLAAAGRGVGIARPAGGVCRGGKNGYWTAAGSARVIALATDETRDRLVSHATIFLAGLFAGGRLHSVKQNPGQTPFYKVFSLCFVKCGAFRRICPGVGHPGVGQSHPYGSMGQFGCAARTRSGRVARMASADGSAVGDIYPTASHGQSRGAGDAVERAFSGPEPWLRACPRYGAHGPRCSLFLRWVCGPAAR